jgi:hypothetical protein
MTVCVLAFFYQHETTARYDQIVTLPPDRYSGYSYCIRYPRYLYSIRLKYPIMFSGTV